MTAVAFTAPADVLLAQEIGVGTYCGTCGGLLVSAAGDGRWSHTGQCIDCPADGVCDYPEQHTCPDADPQPAPCGHDVDHGCDRPADLLAGPCERGHDACCGCCHDGDGCWEYDR